MYGRDFLYFKHDGSLDEGCELVTHPMSPEYMMSDAGKKMWRDICEAALAEGMRSHDTSTCGLHVHVSRDFFGKTGMAQELTELKLIETVDRLFEPSSTSPAGSASRSTAGPRAATRPSPTAAG